uniref:4'-phosphopantetheinyl transferase domain-containing protein n=1 Tax=Favella ehrenbergii TaxID=182087 RepID=A0A7S3MLE1_9SPIT|mmetsp:Transcript_24282/g.30098  ORF Transcript_24282/g.30098 Transcript_24282/m.30098 type:complete len:149 (+) Transcript_24282:3-449(+)
MRQRGIIGIGVDICKVARIQSLLERGPYYHERFLTGTFHPSEVEEFRAKEVDHVRVQYLASRWALKEALVKASGRTDLDYRGIYLLKDAQNKRKKPLLAVSGDKNQAIFYDELDVCAMHASISHEEDYAVAFVTLEGLLEVEESVPKD